MMVEMINNNAFKNYFYEKKYSACVLILKNKISSFVVSQIQKIDPEFSYTTVTDLITSSDFYLQNSIIANQLQLALRHEDPLEQIQSLLSICENHNIK